MSINIYNGWRWPVSEGLFPVLGLLKTACIKVITNHLKQTAVRMKITDNYSARLELADYLGKITQMARTLLERNSGDLNMVFFIREADSYYLMLPEDNRIDFTLVNKALAKYTFDYYDNRDKPKDISYNDWEARGEIWTKGWNSKSPRVEFPILTMSAPSMQIREILCPELFGKAVRKNYWTVPKE